MATLQERIETATTKLESDADRMHDIVNGGAAVVVETEGGPVSSVAKQVADLEAAYAAAGAVAACEAERVGAETARTGAENAQVASEGFAVAAAADAATAAAIVATMPREDSTTIASAHTVTAAEKGWQFTVNASSGPVPVTAPNSADVSPAIDEPWPLWVVKSKEDTSSNAVTILPQGTDTINGGASYSITKAGAGVRLTLDEDVAPHNWTVVEFGAATGDAEPIGFLKSFAKGALPYGYLPRDGSGFLVAAFPDLAALMYVGDGNNATASAWYRFTDLGNPTGTRSTTGAYMKTPAPYLERRKTVDLGSAVTSGSTGYSLLGIPANAETVEIDVDLVSLSGAARVLIQAIVGGAPVTSGYVASGQLFPSGTSAASSTAGFIPYSSGAAIVLSGRLFLTKTPGTNTWKIGGTLLRDDTATYTDMLEGHVTLAGDIEGVRFTSTGSDTYDGGTIRARAVVPYTDEGIPCIKAFGAASTPAEADIASLVAETQAQNAKITQINSGTPDFVGVTASPLVGNTLYTFPHGLGVEPSDVKWAFLVTTAVAGYSVGEYIPAYAVIDQTGTSAWGGFTMQKDATQIIARVTANGPLIAHKTTFAATGLTLASVKLVCMASKGSTLTGGGSTPVMATDTVIAQGPVDIPHALGKVPTRLDFAYHCINASQGFSAGEYVPVAPWPSGVSEAAGSPWLTGSGFQVISATDTLIRVKFANGYSSTSTISLLHKSTGVRADVANADWRITARVS